MKKTLLTSVASLALVCPAFADIDKSASTATCDSATIGATSGTAYMDTDWTANTINLDFYSDGEKISTGSCTYDGAIELPNDPEDKTGYTFGGWKVRQAAVSTFDLTTLAETLPLLSTRSYAHAWYNDSDYCFAYGDGTVKTGGTEVCATESSALSDVAINEFKTVFSVGTFLGNAKCSETEGEYHASRGNPSDTTGHYCWCKVTEFDPENNGTYQPVSPSSWVYTSRSKDWSDDTCSKDCVFQCSNLSSGNTQAMAKTFRKRILGL